MFLYAFLVAAAVTISSTHAQQTTPIADKPARSAMPTFLQRRYNQLLDELRKAPELSPALQAKTEKMFYFLSKTYTAEAAALENYVQIHVVLPPSVATHAESISLGAVEPFTQLTYGQLRARQKAAGNSLILARVVTQGSDNVAHVTYCEAFRFSAWYFGLDFLQHKKISKVKSEIDGYKIQAPVVYVAYTPTEHPHDFTSVFSEKEFMKQRKLRLAVAMEQNVDPIEKIYAFLQAGIMYHEGEGAAKNDKHARKFFEVVAQQTLEPYAQARARFELGELYGFGGAGIGRDSAQARRYLQPVAEQSDYTELQEQAKNLLMILAEIEESEKQSAGAAKTNEELKEAQSSDDPDGCVVS